MPTKKPRPSTKAVSKRVSKPRAATSKQAIARTVSSLGVAAEGLNQVDAPTIAQKGLQVAFADMEFVRRLAEKIVSNGNVAPLYSYDSAVGTSTQIWLIATFPPGFIPLTFRTLIDVSGAGSVVRFEDPYIPHV